MLSSFCFSTPTLCLVPAGKGYVMMSDEALREALHPIFCEFKHPTLDSPHATACRRTG